MDQANDKSLRRRLGSLSPAQRAALAARVARTHDHADHKTIPRLPQPHVEGDGTVVRQASFSEQRMWFLHHYSPGVPLYNAPRAFRIRGPLDRNRIEAAIAHIAQRHESLRTTLEMCDGDIAQRIRPAPDFKLPSLDLAALPEPQAEQDAAAAIHTISTEPFDLCRGPLFRARLIRLRHEDHVLLVVFHHAISDGWSMAIFWKELGTLYRHLADDGPPPQPLPIQFADFSAWQRSWLNAGPIEDEVRHWRDQLRGAPAALDLPADRPRPPSETFRGETLGEPLDPPIRNRIEAIARDDGATPFMAFLAAFCTLLMRYSGQEDIVIGTPIANRVRPETEGLIGYFANSLPLRIDLAGDPPFRELLRRVKVSTLDACAHQNVPFDFLVERLDVVRDASRSPVFQHMFVYRDFPESRPEFPGLSIRPWPVSTGTSKFDLSWHVDPTPEGLAIAAEYATDLFDAARIRRMLRHWTVLLEGIAADPATPLSRLPLLSPEEERLLLVDWNPGPRDTPARKCLQQLFAEQVARSPDATAIDTGSTRLSYGELDAASDTIAHGLRAAGAAPDSRVALLADRCPEMVVAILGILKSGAAYVPLDPGYPTARLELMLSDSAALALVAQPHLLGILPAPPCPVIPLDRTMGPAPTPARPSAAVAPSHLAYVMYTSGSSGTPKGVMVEHAAAANYALAAGEMFGLGPEDRFLQFASPCFDTSVQEIFATLAHGATLVLRDDAMLDSMPAFLQRCRQLDISAMHLPTAFWHALVAAMGEDGLEIPERVRLVAIGGERARPDTVASWHHLAPARVRLINSYGPTECTVSATWCDLAPDIGAPIGRPVPNCQAHVLDRYRNLCPVGITGELFVGGACLARGYLGRPELTAAQFAPNPFDASHASRLYRTGDLARRRADGMLDFVGRIDDQIKIRGFRIEPAEIEAALATHPHVTSCAVVAAPDPRNEPQIVAYVTPADPSGSLPRDIRDFLRRLLPDYMVPAHVVALAELPINANGKVDRGALPSPRRSTLPEDSHARPLGPSEARLAAIWRDVLQIPRVEAGDNFFDLGGHSLLAMRLMGRIAQSFGISLPLRVIFEFPTLAALAKAIDRAGPAEAAPRHDPIPRLAHRSRAINVSRAQQDAP